MFLLNNPSSGDINSSNLPCYALLCVHFRFATILKRKRKLVALLLLSYRCFSTINVLWLFLTVQCVIVVFPNRTHLLLGTIKLLKIFLLTVRRRLLLLFMFRVCHAFLSVHCSLVVRC